jgi:hypothetical protein
LVHAASSHGDGASQGDRFIGVIESREVVAAHRELCEASDAVRHLLVVETLTQPQIDDARGRLARAYEQAEAIDSQALRVLSNPAESASVVAAPG